MPVHFFQGKDSEHYFSIHGDNGQVVAQSEGYTQAHDAKRGYAALERIVTAPVRDALLNMLADATRFDEDVDGDESGMDINYHITVGHSQLLELCEALGIVPTQLDESIGDTLKDLIASEPVPAAPTLAPGAVEQALVETTVAQMAVDSDKRRGRR